MAPTIQTFIIDFNFQGVRVGTKQYWMWRANSLLQFLLKFIQCDSDAEENNSIITDNTNKTTQFSSPNSKVLQNDAFGK